MYTIMSRWDSPAAFTADYTYNRLIALGAKEPSKGFLKAVIATIYAVGPQAGLNSDLVTAHCANETDYFRSPIYLSRGVIDGLGVTDGGDQGLSFTHGDDAALADLVHRYAYVHGAIVPSNILYPSLQLDPRYSNVIAAGWAGSVHTVKDMTGKWFTDPTGAESVISKATAIFGEFTMPVDSPAEVVPMEITFDRVPKPLMTINHCSKIGSGHGYTELGRGRRVVGACDHITDGYGSLQFYHDFFSIGGEREANALVDYVIDRAGNIIELNDPFGSRMPWANGGTDGLEGDGPAYVSTLGVGMVNEGLISIEHVGVSPDAMTGAQLEKSAQLKAWLFDTVDVPYTSFPVNPDVGIVTHMQHFEFATKPCPGPGIRAQTSQLQARIVAIMKQYQEATIVDPPVPTTPPPPKPVSIYPKNMTLQLAKRLYGSITVPWSSKTFTFDPARSECQNWIEWGKEQLDDGDDYTKAEWPQLVDIIRRGATHNVHAYQYSNGKVFEKSIREG